ncbi:MAG: T9SS type A sorting domain-containing protein [Ignavibacteriaceae bacterium]|nr:T9SS type A sorting domain-containing protein [Ignavibacteriaceae bacterium]
MSVDTAVAGFDARFEYLGERLQDETIITGDGTFDCKKFLITWKVSVLFPPLPPIELLSTKDTVWIADVGNEFGIVQDIVPTNHIDLSLLGIEPFSIPGFKTYLIDTIIVSARNDGPVIPTEIVLKQNYPNPFNPSTKIEFSIQNFGFVSLKVYDILGNEITTLVNSVKPIGVYEVEWKANGLPSGTYFYQLKIEGYVETKKMVLMK